ncbi:MAG: hypothetical protein D6722_10325, partial [Bacteroidetes bacterium]
MTRLTLLLLFFLAATAPTLAQEAFKPSVKVGGSVQVWMRYNQHNPGTLDADGDAVSNGTDISIRRARLTVTAQPSPRSQVYIQVGANNLVTTKKATMPFIHDAWASYELIPAGEGPVSLLMGGGLHFWNGFSRLSSGSYRSSILVDLPDIHLPNISRTDLAGRQMGIFASGTASRLAFRFHLNKPYLYGDSLDITSSSRAQNLQSTHWATGGHVAWEFLDREDQTRCYRTGTYLTPKRILN